jgi:two-component system, chemotaxis family, protein-glutamate methylesterase/glutaminase
MTVAAAPRLRVVIIDDSVATRRWIRRVLERAQIEVVAEAGDGRSGRDRIVEHDPDVVLLDLEMPGIDGLTLLRAITKYAPRPVVVLSGQNVDDRVTVTALEAGATHVLVKPKGTGDTEAMGEELVRRTRQAARSAIRYGAVMAAEVAPVDVTFAPRQLVAIGASTGGPTALRHVLASLPRTCPPIVITQHTPPQQHTLQFAGRLAQETGLDVCTARAGEVLGNGMVRVAPPDRHLVIEWTAAGYQTQLGHGPAENDQRPAVDVMFRSVATAAQRAAVGVLLTGMGEDGAAGVAVLKTTAPLWSIAQDEATCVIYGMPQAVVRRGLDDEVLPLPSIAPRLAELARRLA